MTPTTVVSAAALDAEPGLDAFGNDPWWIILIKALAVFVFLMLCVLMMIMADRKVMGRMQQRHGPNRFGPWGLLQSLADGVKLSLKEDLIPRTVDKVIYIAAPMIAAIPAFFAFSVIPVGPEVTMFGVETRLQLTDLPVAVLLVLATASLGVYGIVLAGWASRSPYPLLGGLRASAQVISYEIAMGLSFIAVFIYAGTLSTSGIVEAQQNIWFAVILFPSFVIYLITMIGETNRLPFDLPEGEGELVGGFMTEYSSMKFTMFFLAEYVNMVTVSAMSVTPVPRRVPCAAADHHLLAGRQRRLVACAVVAHQVRLRDVPVRLGPRLPAPGPLRPAHETGMEDPHPHPAGLDHCGRCHPGAQQPGVPGYVTAIVVGVFGLLVFLGLWAWSRAAAKAKAQEAAEHEAELRARRENPMYGGFPVPPMIAPHYGTSVLAEEPRYQPASAPKREEVSGA